MTSVAAKVSSVGNERLLGGTHYLCRFSGYSSASLPWNVTSNFFILALTVLHAMERTQASYSGLAVTTKAALSSVQFSRSVVSNSLRPHESIAARQASLSITNSWSLPKLTLVMPSSHLILCCPLLLLPPIPPSIGVFSNESAIRIRGPKY